MSAASTLRVTEADAVAEVLLARPPVNAVSLAMVDELLEAVRALAARADISAVVLGSASERAFCAGADIKELAAMPEAERSTYDGLRQSQLWHLFEALVNLPQPTVAAINGAAIGTGAVLAACCDVRYASERAWLALKEIEVARCGGGRHLMRLLPQGTVREMYFTGRPLSAEQAFRLGSVQRLLPHGQELAAAHQLAREIAAKSPVALRYAKSALNAAEPLPLGEGYAEEQRWSLRLGETEDAREAARAFAEQRTPRWTGR